MIKHQQATGETSGPTLCRKGYQTGYAIVVSGQMTAEQIRRRQRDLFTCQLHEQAISLRCNDAAREHKRQCDFAKRRDANGNKREKPKRPKKRPDIEHFGAAYLPTGFA